MELPAAGPGMAGADGVGGVVSEAFGARFVGNAELDAIETARHLAAVAAAQPLVLGLAGEVRRWFLAAEEHKQSYVVPRLEECQRRRAGQYDAATLARIRELGGNESYPNITQTKCSAAESWIQDVMAPAGAKPWGLEATPKPLLPDSIKQRTVEAVMLRFEMEMQQTGVRPTRDVVVQFAEQLRDEVEALYLEEAKVRAQRMELEIEDRLAEANFLSVLHRFITDLCTFPAAFLKGPCLRKRRKLQWNGETLAVQWVDAMEFYCVSPWDIYPAPNATNLNEGPLCELVTWDIQDLAAMRGTPGWSDVAIEGVMADVDSTTNPITDTFLHAQQSRYSYEARDSSKRSGMAPGLVRGVECWGQVQGTTLREWSNYYENALFDQVVDLEFYDVHLYLFGSYVVYAQLNPDPLDRRPYYSAGYKVRNNTIWHDSIPELMADIQDECAATIRSILNNLALASGPQVAVDLDALDPRVNTQTVSPWKIWGYRSSRITGPGRKAVEFDQPQVMINELMNVNEFFEQKADDRTLIPRYAHGNTDVGGAGDTASGLSALLEQGAKGIKRILGSLDQDVIKPLIERVYTWIMLYHDDPEIKGDAQVVAKGVLSVIAREVVNLRRIEALDRTNNQVDLQIMGLRGRAELLRSTLGELQIDTDKIIKSDEEIAQMEAAEAEAAMQLQGAGAGFDDGVQS